MSAQVTTLIGTTKVIPVLAFTEVASTLKIIENMIRSGVTVIELTLRSPVARETLRAAKSTFGKDAAIGMGTVINAAQLTDIINDGADFGVSPGLTPALQHAILDSGLPFLPGVANVSQAMAAQDAGFKLLKFFPAEQAGGAPYLKSIGAVLPDVKFCPTGGITEANAAAYLALPNVICVGSSALTKRAAEDSYAPDAFDAVLKAFT